MYTCVCIYVFTYSYTVHVNVNSVCVCVQVIHILGQKDFTLHTYSSVQKPKKATAKSTVAGHNQAKSSGFDELKTTDQESKLISYCTESNDQNCSL